MGLWKKFIEFNKRCIVARGNLGSFSQKTNLKCPKCKKEIYQIINSKGVPTNNYVCRKCGYTGALALEIKNIKQKNN